MTVVLRPAAAADVRAARDAYEKVRPELGDALADDLDRLFARLDAFPKSAPMVAGYEGIRRALLRTFPYAVFYRLGKDRIDVLRVIHTSRSSEIRPRQRRPGV